MLNVKRKYAELTPLKGTDNVIFSYTGVNGLTGISIKEYELEDIMDTFIEMFAKLTVRNNNAHNDFPIPF